MCNISWQLDSFYFVSILFSVSNRGFFCSDCWSLQWGKPVYASDSIQQERFPVSFLVVLIIRPIYIKTFVAKEADKL